jgi:transcriptional regulator with XRE-family HTH domain
MNSIQAISGALKSRRQELGLSLADVARRADTSAATLSRYENGWTRFEVSTLHKLATALHCELKIAFCPTDTATRSPIDTPKAVDRLKRLFWDKELTSSDFADHTQWVVERVLEYGGLDDIYCLRDTLGTETLLKTVAQTARFSAKTAAFWKNILKRVGITCTKRYSRSTRLSC